MFLVTQALARKPGKATGSRGLHGRQPSLLWADARGLTQGPLYNQGYHTKGFRAAQ